MLYFVFVFAPVAPLFSLVPPIIHFCRFYDLLRPFTPTGHCVGSFVLFHGVIHLSIATVIVSLACDVNCFGPSTVL